MGASEQALGSYHSCGLTTGGAVYCWGGNSAGQLAIGTTDFSAHTTPAAVSGLSSITQIAAGQYHTCARRSTGEVYCWGANGWAVRHGLAHQLRDLAEAGRDPAAVKGTHGSDVLTLPVAEAVNVAKALGRSLVALHPKFIPATPRLRHRV